MHEVSELTRSTSCDRGANSKCSRIEEPSASQSMSHYRMTDKKRGQALPQTAEPIPWPPRAGLATRLSDFATNRHEQCGLDSVSFRFPSWQSLDWHPVPPANYAPGMPPLPVSLQLTKNRKAADRLQACRLNASPRSVSCSGSSCPRNLAAFSHHRRNALRLIGFAQTMENVLFFFSNSDCTD
jgi:hypothetical protein